MIQQVIEHVNSNISALNSFAVLNGLCEYITKPMQEGEDQRFPALYKSGDQLSQVTKYDFKSGFVFHARNGETVIEPQESPRANKDFLKYTTPLQLVAIVRRSITGMDNNYSHEQLANNIIHQVQERNINSLKQVLGLSKIESAVTSFSTDSENIDRVFQNIEIRFRHDLSIILVDYEIRLWGYKECFTNYSC